MTVWIALNGFIIIQKSPFNSKVKTIYQTYFVTRSLFHFSIIVTRLIFNPHHINKVTWILKIITGDHCPLLAGPDVAASAEWQLSAAPGCPMFRVTRGLPGTGARHSAPGSVMTQQRRHQPLICHPHTSMWRLMWAIMPCPLRIKCCWLLLPCPGQWCTLLFLSPNAVALRS